MDALTSLGVLLCVLSPLCHHGQERGPREAGLVGRWGIDAIQISNDQAVDDTGTFIAKIAGDPVREGHGPADGYLLSGKDWLVITDDVTKQKSQLPTRELSVAAWVVYRRTESWGSILGAIQDNGGFEKGWLLGNRGDLPAFGLSTIGADDGDGKMTYLTGRTPLEIGRWYHIVGTYDGKRMRIYINGRAEAESAEQSGDILYPEHAPFTLGCYLDNDETYPLDGLVHDVRLYNRVLSPEEIEASFDGKRAYAEFVPPQERELRLVVPPYLQFATQTAMTIKWETNLPSTAVVEYGTAMPLTIRSAPSNPARIGEVRLENLTPETHYFYRVVVRTDDGQEIAAEQRTFATAVRADSAYAFTVIGDTQKNVPVIAEIAKSAYKLRPNFQIHCGDVVDSGPTKAQWVEELLRPSNDLMSRVPVFPVIGNHEEDSHWYYDYFALPTPEYYYTFAYGNAQFFMIDTNRPVTPGSEQYVWLDKALSECKATWKFAAHHHPIYSSDSDDHGDTYKEESTWGDMKHRPLAALYEKHGVDIVFNGHIHVYERTWPIRVDRVDEDRGVRYITSGGSGGGLEAAAPSRSWFQLHFNSAHHFCYVTIHNRTMQFKAIDVDGRLFDTFELRKSADAAGLATLRR